MEQPQTLFYKSKGPGHDNSYVARFEDYAILRSPANAADPFDRFKFTPLDRRDDAYLTLNGEVRFRFDDASWRNFGVATAVIPAKQEGGLPTLTPKAPARDNYLLKQRAPFSYCGLFISTGFAAQKPADREYI